MDLVKFLAWTEQEFGVTRNLLFTISNHVCTVKGASHYAEEVCDDTKDEFVDKWPRIRDNTAGQRERFLRAFRLRVHSRLIDRFRSAEYRRHIPLDFASPLSRNEGQRSRAAVEWKLREQFGERGELLTQVILLHEHDGLSESECARRLGISVRNCIGLLRKARAILLRSKPDEEERS